MTRAFRAARATALVAAAVPAILAPPAGGAITIRLDAETTVAAAATTLRLTATNAGGETARHIAPEVTWLDRPRPAEAVAALDPGGRQRWDLALPPAPAAGAFPLVIRVRYADANGYPLSALLVHLVRTPGAPAGPVRAGLVAGPVTTFGTARLRLEDPGPRAVAGRVVVALPAELTTDPESQPAQVPAQGHVELPLVVQNASALVGSAYPMYALFEYDWEGVHQAVVGEATLRVAAASAAGRGVPLAVGTAALLATLALFAVLWRRDARRRASGAGRTSARGLLDRRAAGMLEGPHSDGASSPVRGS
ncbi:MAG TPA: hypothetical protein VKW76_00355 [Candidatus Binatia bacterium]|nr:hypothetical protein [Candidatus Binatia bacterium]